MTWQTPEDARFREQRRSALLQNGSVSGLDFIEARGHPGGEPVWRLRLHFLPSRPEGLSPGSFRVVGPGGEVDPDVQVTRIGAIQEAAGGLDLFLRVTDPARAARLRTDPAEYRLEIDSPGLDRFFSSAPFRFDGQLAGAGAPAEAAGEAPAAGRIDYLAKDYDSFRQVMLERMGAAVPEWTERNPADLGVAIVEVLAYAADYLSYYQDAVATEAYLDTARKRSSVRRHLRLLGYCLHEGCNSRTWAQLRLEGRGEIDLPAGTALLTQAGDLPGVLLEGSPQLAAALAQGSLTFETMHPARLRPWLNNLPVHTWGAEEYSVPRGATSVALAGHFDELEAGDPLILELVQPREGDEPDPRQRHAVRLRAKPRLAGDPLVAAPITEIEFVAESALPFDMTVSKSADGGPSGKVVARAGHRRMPLHTGGREEYSLPRGATSAVLAGHFDELRAGNLLMLELLTPCGGGERGPRQRHPVRLRNDPTLNSDRRVPAPITEIEFFDEDALPFAMTASKSADGGPSGEIVARANVVLADHGRTVSEELPRVEEGELYRPALSRTGVTRCEPFDAVAAGGRAAAAVSQRAGRALPQVTLFELAGDGGEIVGEPWVSRRDLLQSQPFSTDFVAETETDGTVRLRFGDGRQGRKPTPGTRFLAVHRVGNGPSGHIGHDSLGHIVGGEDLPIVGVSNPLPSEGGEAREPLERARLVAPRAFRETESCVTPADLVRLAESHPEVLRAVAELRWTGSWETLFLFVQRPRGAALTPAFERRLRAFLEPRLLAGADLEIRSSGPLPLEIRLRGEIEPSAVTQAVRTALLERLGCSDLDDGRRGYFHPDNFTFGQPVYLDGVLDEAMQVAGVVSMAAERFRPWGSPADTEPICARVEPGPVEVVTLRNRAAEPELGILSVVLEGGS